MSNKIIGTCDTCGKHNATTDIINNGVYFLGRFCEDCCPATETDLRMYVKMIDLDILQEGGRKAFVKLFRNGIIKANGRIVLLPAFV